MIQLVSFFFDKLPTKAFNISKILYSMKNLGIWRIVLIGKVKLEKKIPTI